jgi:hypothetical protein
MGGGALGWSASIDSSDPRQTQHRDVFTMMELLQYMSRQLPK